MRTGTIARARLLAVLDAGPAKFLTTLEVTPRMRGDRFVGWQLVQLLDRDGVLVGVDVVPGDVLLAVNGQPLSRPDQLQTLWDSLRGANELVADLWRGAAKLQLRFAIEPKVDAAPSP
jgi:type II secretory pathway component PulC